MSGNRFDSHVPVLLPEACRWCPIPVFWSLFFLPDSGRHRMFLSRSCLPPGIFHNEFLPPDYTAPEPVWFSHPPLSPPEKPVFLPQFPQHICHRRESLFLSFFIIAFACLTSAEAEAYRSKQPLLIFPFIMIPAPIPVPIVTIRKSQLPFPAPYRNSAQAAASPSFSRYFLQGI